jgi:protein involved in polysaccharide export with SLBB domain
MPSTIAELACRMRYLLVATLLVLAACDSDTTPIVPYDTVNSPTTSLSLADDGKGGASANDYRLGPNDRTRIIVFGQSNLTGEFVLDGKGALAFPLIGRIPASGMTASELQQAITKRLDPEFMRDPSVSVEVTSRRPFYVVGEVTKPGSFPFVTDMTVLNAVATAGGQTARANMSSFYVKRLVDGRTIRILANQESRLLPGDTVMVRERSF